MLFRSRDLYVLKVDEGGLITWSQGIQIDKQSTTVYPNPGTDFFYVNTNNKKLYFELVNRNGQIVIEQILDNNRKYINTQTLESGMYFYRLIDKKNKIVETGKWMKL